MDIKHPRIFEEDKVIAIYEAQDGVDIKYVCTTDLLASDRPADIFYRSSPHPEFGNRYFGLYKNHLGQLMITNADMVEDFEFGMIKSADEYALSLVSHHDCIFIEDKMIDGGRESPKDIFKIVDGEFVHEQ